MALGGVRGGGPLLYPIWVYGLGLVWGSSSAAARVSGLGFRVSGLGFRVSRFGF